MHSHAVEMCARSYPPRRTSLTVGIGRERVQLVLRREGAVLHVIAVCRPEVAALVRRALASADAYVRGSGDTLRASVQTTEEDAVRA
jgi:NAD(P)-dependent dehydrogenase (short-subunit alcohol dehydrogenase family)